MAEGEGVDSHLPQFLSSFRRQGVQSQQPFKLGLVEWQGLQTMLDLWASPLILAS